jgi:hypothetical protein
MVTINNSVKPVGQVLSMTAISRWQHFRPERGAGCVTLTHSAAEANFSISRSSYGYGSYSTIASSGADFDPAGLPTLSDARRAEVDIYAPVPRTRGTVPPAGLSFGPASRYFADQTVRRSYHSMEFPGDNKNALPE